MVSKLISELSPAAPAAALTAPERPSLPTVGTTVAAARIAAHWHTSPSCWCCGGRIRAPSVEAGAGQRARAASAAGRVWAAK
jgi:hypothetical protein